MKEIGDFFVGALIILGGLALVLMLFSMAFYMLNSAFDDRLSDWIMDKLEEKDKK